MSLVLIIEDEPLIAMAIEMALQDAGAQSFAYADTEDAAVTAARDHRPDLITSDVSLLDGTGPCAVRTIQHEIGDIPVIFLTGTPEDCEPCEPPGSILSKPFDATILISAYHKALGHTATG